MKKFEFPNEISKCNYTARNIPIKGVILFPFTLLVVVVILPLIRNINHSSYEIISVSKSETIATRRCNIFSGNWAPYLEKPYYNNETCNFMYHKHNCLKHGRPDREFLQWRWKPNECELPLFDATLFLKLVRGKSMAFVGDSIGRNQMESLLCLLNTVAHPEDVTAKFATQDTYNFRWWFYADYNFTLAMLWSPYLVNSNNSNLDDNTKNLYLDEADKDWASQIENFDYVIISAGQWFFGTLNFYENGKIVGCQRCQKNMTELNLYGYKMAYRTALRTMGNLKGFKGLTFLVTHSPNHYENGEWYEGGTCDRTKLFTKEERLEYKRGELLKSLYEIQVEEFKAEEQEAKKKGLQFALIDISELMLLRPDGHPSRYGRMVENDKSIKDCVHWCMPGPVDTWNEFLLYMMKLEGEN